MTDGETTGVDAGVRIALLRAQQGLTQQVLADLAHVSYSLLTKVETGVKPATDALIAACAGVLGVTPDVLAGHHGGMADSRLLALMSPIRAALDLLDLPPAQVSQPRPLNELRSAVRRMNWMAQSARYERMAVMLPRLVAELHAAAHVTTGTEQQATWALLADAVRCAHSVGIAIGLNDLSTTALQRMDWAAQHAGDQGPGLRAAREYLRVTAYLRAKDYETCWRLNAAGLAHLDGTDDRTPGAVVARGQLHLGASIIAARSGDQDTMTDHLAEAQRIAEVTGEQTERFWFGFGPTNVHVHRVMALAAAGEHGRAVEASQGLKFPKTWLPSRIGHHHLDLANVYRWMNKPESALEELVAARQVAPGQAQRHPLAHDTVVALVQSARRQSSVLTEYATWVGV